MTKITLCVTPEPKTRCIGDLPVGTCYSREHELFIRQKGPYALRLDDMESVQVHLYSDIERVFDSVTITAE